MIYIGSYPRAEVMEYKKYIESKIDEDLQRDIVQLLNNDLDTDRVQPVLSFEELITMDFTRLKSICSNFKSTSKIEKIKKDINFFKKTRDDELSKEGNKSIIQYIENLYNNIILDLEKDLGIINTTLTRYKNKYAIFTRDRRGGKKNNIELSKALKLTVCPYCNRNFINNRGDRESGRQFDHFFSKDEIPYFALSLYNLVPSCSTCNHTKSTIEMEYCPFELENDVYRKLEFLVEFPAGNITVKDTVSDVRTLKLNEAYEIHSVDVKRLFDIERVYCQDYRNDLLKKINPKYHFLLTESQFDQMVFGEIVNLDHSKFRNEVLSYLKYDTYHMIKKCREDKY